jgi:hypothetical protein
MNERPKREGFIDPDEVSDDDVRQQQPQEIEAEAEGPTETPDVWPMRVRLKYKPISISGRHEVVHEVTFREPTGRDINRNGNPTRMGPDMMFIIDEPKMMRMMASLSGIMTPDLEKMDARDWNTCAWKLYRFFLPTTILD